MICPHCRQPNVEWVRRCFHCAVPLRPIVRWPETAVPHADASEPDAVEGLIDRLYCECIDEGASAEKKATALHAALQDEQADGWKQLLELVDMAAADGREEFKPFAEMTWEARSQVITLPSTIGKLKGVRSLHLYGGYLERLPAEIGDMESLEEFTPYRCMRLHWFPYEITRCTRLASSTVSTRTLYGNYKYRPPFPQLATPLESTVGLNLKDLPPSQYGAPTIITCSVCRASIAETGLHQAWISLNVGTDVLPLLVNACSRECIDKLPPTPDGYVSGPHAGGPSVIQPAAHPIGSPVRPGSSRS